MYYPDPEPPPLLNGFDLNLVILTFIQALRLETCQEYLSRVKSSSYLESAF